MAKIANQNLLIRNIRGLTKIHLYIGVAFVVSLLVFDAWKLITPDSSLLQWLMALVFVTVSVLVWIAGRFNEPMAHYYTRLVYYLVALDIVWASFEVYTQRGMSSRAVMLYALPIVTAAVFRNRRTLVWTSFFSILGYFLSATTYFRAYPSEGYKVELYGTIGFYGAMLAGLALIAWVTSRPKQD